MLVHKVCTAVWYMFSQFLICAPLTKTTHRLNLEDPSPSFCSSSFVLLLPNTFKNRHLLFLCLPPVFLVFSAPLGVLRDFCCSVKAAAALMAHPSRAVIQTYRLLEYKSCPAFALAGSSSRRHTVYLFINL